ncbi:unnamed protein product [Rotaria sp. Silwood1]|nr:unnamed protein product [Rotaria sp. Silwood1]CAF4925924.1 unnamed protein product [Rotaria sp. Silwood1]
MGKYFNPGYCYAQNYAFRFPRNPVAASTTHTTSPMGGQIGLLLNGIPIYGLSNANSWTGSTNSPMGLGIWNMEVGKAEGFVLDTAFGAHPQQQGAYHSHTTPYRLYKNVATTTHSPIVGYAFDGYPVYGPYGYIVATNASSAVTRMKSGYALRNITTRAVLPSGVTATQTGPAVNTTYPLGTYAEDYAWSASNGGDLDQYNGRYCVTPEYPSGTYAYFVTIDAAGKAVFPYYIGFQYYGITDTKNITAAGQTSTDITFPVSGTTCKYPTTLPVQLSNFYGKNNGSNNTIYWTTANEVNIKQYVIEASTDGIDFKPLAVVDTKGNRTSEQQYYYTDKNIFTKTYYRILSVEKDGTTSSSNILVLTRKVENKLSVYPTITNNTIHITASNINTSASINIYNTMGIKVISKYVAINNGSTTSIDVSLLSNNFYFVVIEGENGYKLVERIVKQ